MVNIAYLLLGTNLGNKKLNLQQALSLLEQDAGPVVKASACYETLPWGVTEQPTFWNRVLCIQTTLSPVQLLPAIHVIEQALGRERRSRWTERIIDIDILYYDTVILETDNLVIPHPQLQNRRFTLIPLVEIAPEYQHPVFGITNRELLEKCPDTLSVELIEPGL